mgnify:FL=1
MIALTISFSAELFWKIQPCNLCKLQRLPLFMIIPLSLVGLCGEKKRFFLSMICLAFFIFGTLSGYHLLVQLKFITDPCVVPQNIKTLDDFKMMLNSSPACSTISWSIFSVPISGYNLAFSLIFFLSLFNGLKNTNFKHNLVFDVKDNAH